ncbi:hypothetical protein KX928_14495 [Roseobacter sp. YSTF-M11]|uniref:Uncharacterized protein n=1 Tax=Roseobacter insulae TaxID=2859783 RepID=A0A9X1FWH4_9RHOB|nr:hypothetical protein [Roseobacter insulae]MBW4708996.1 hypothetical protein [Roseobacter insulae]
MIHWKTATEAEAEAVMAFYKDHDHRHIAVRPDKTRRAIARGNAVICLSRGAIVAAGLIMTGMRGTYELGQGRVILNGLSLYKTLIISRTALAFHRDQTATGVFCEIDEPNARAQAVFESLSFREFQPTTAQRDASLSQLPPEKRPDQLGFDFRWFEISRAEFQHNLNGPWRKHIMPPNAGQQRVVCSPEIADAVSGFGINMPREMINEPA